MVFKAKVYDAKGKYWKKLTFKSKEELSSFKRHFRKVAPKISIKKY